LIYLDYNATTPLAPEAMRAMLPFLERDFGNPSSIHAAGRAARAAIDLARDRLAALLGVKAHEIIFTAGGTEADNLAIIGLARARADRGRHLITSATEHHAVLQACEYLERHERFRVTYLPVDEQGLVAPATLAAAIEKETTLVSIMTANNETGVLQPVDALSEICRAHDLLFHSDAVQSFGKVPLDSARHDAFSLAAHKFHGPKGAGILYLRGGITIAPTQHGGAHEGQRRAGTENVAAIAGMAAAAERALMHLEERAEREARLRDQLWAGIQTIYPAAIWNGARAPRLANTLNVSFPGLDGESLLIGLDLEGVCASSGSACMVGSIVPSHVLMAMGVAPNIAQATVRFSLGTENTNADIAETLQRLDVVMHRLQRAAA
jgi:cysteine desulfurase